MCATCLHLVPDPVSYRDSGPMADTGSHAVHNGEDMIIVIIGVIAIAIINSRAPGHCRAFYAGHFWSHENSAKVRIVISVLRKRRQLGRQSDLPGTPQLRTEETSVTPNCSAGFSRARGHPGSSDWKEMSCLPLKKTSGWCWRGQLYIHVCKI